MKGKINAGVWVKASDRLPNKLDYYNCRLAGIPVVFWIDHKNEAIISEKGTTMNKILFKSIEWLDESQPQQKEVDESEKELEERTEKNMNIISDFCEHVKNEAGLVIPESTILSFFNA